MSKERDVAAISREIGAPTKSVYKYIQKLDSTQKSADKPNESNKIPAVKSKNINNVVKIYDLGTFKQFHKKYLDYLLLAIITTFIVYANSLGGDFVSDDITGIIQNPNFTQESLGLRVSSVSELTHLIIFKTFGETPLPYHLFSLSLHLANVYLGFMLFSQLFSRKKAMLAALFFALHPINTEAVAWISAINYPMYTFFGLLTINLFLFHRTSQLHSNNFQSGKTYYTSVILFFVAVMLTQNAWLVTIPFILVIFDQFLFKKHISISKKTIKEYLPYFAVIGVFLAFFALGGFEQRLQILSTEFGINQEERTPQIYTIPYTLSKSSYLYFFPNNLTFYHEGEQIELKVMYMMITFTAFLILSAFVAIKVNRTYAGLIFAFIISVSPSLSPILFAWFVAERYLYFGSLLFAVLLAEMILQVEKITKVKHASILLAVFVLIFYSIRTISRNNEWKTDKNLWEATARISPNSPRVYNNLGDVYSREGDQKLAIEMFQKAIQLNPNYSHAYHNLGNTYIIVGDLKLAEENFNKSLEIDPNLYQSYHKLGLIKYTLQEYTNAADYFGKALEIAPNYEPSLLAKEIMKQEGHTE